MYSAYSLLQPIRLEFNLAQIKMMPNLRPVNVLGNHQLVNLMPRRGFLLMQNHTTFDSRSFDKKPRRTLCLRGKAKSFQASVSYAVEMKDESRRSSDYHPTIWDHNFLESIQSPYAHEDFGTTIEELKIKVKHLLDASDGLLDNLELIDMIQRLGVAYHFGEEIEGTLARVHNNGFESLRGLNETALCFRLLRQHGYHVSSDVFNKFKDGEGFMNCLVQDVKGLLSLYEATHLGLPGEKILEEAQEFSIRHLKCLSRDENSHLIEQVKHSLEAPSHWLMPRLEARHFIDVYEREEGKIPYLLELAKLDFNVVQSLHQREVKELSRWWQEVGLTKKFSFFRDRLFESYLWGNQTAFEPQFSRCRKAIAKLASISCVIDDFYDIYGSLDEAKLFTSAVRSWDLKAMDTLPDYLKLCYLAWYIFVNETVYDILKDSGCDVTHFLKTEWIRFCEAYLKEAEWFHEGITPSLEEYLENELIDGGLTLAFYIYYFVVENLTEESLDWREEGFQIAYWSALIVRLTDDLAPSQAEMQEEETSSSILCRMKDSGESYEASRAYIEDLLSSAWKHLNKEALNSHVPRNFVNACINTSRVAFTLFQQGDGYGSSTGITKDRINSLFVEPIPME